MNTKRIARSLAALLACGFFASAPSLAEEWPAKPIQVIVPAPGGGGTGDAIARLVSERLAQRLNANIVIENRGGANGNIGAAAAARSAPDGYRLLFSWAGTLAVNPAMHKNPGFDPVESFEPIGLVADVPNILVVNNELPVKDFGGFIDYAKSNPDKLNFASSGNGSSMHLAGALFMQETGTRLVHVPYTAPGQATTNLIAGDIQAMFQLVPGIAGHVRGGMVRPLAIMSPVRSSALPDVPTTAELGYPRLVSSTWFALLAPKGISPEIADRINTALNEVLSTPEMHKQLSALGAVPSGGSRQALAEHLSTELTKWGQLVKSLNIEAE
ncbi:tripartite tricarboxylate transporter substrate binding protein [Alcaligenaceae bacterium]|nr:tripartite tricarboxylate transporter substrate binding protein [Alcaligenaceae bacterium]